jgi:hypothetical protein
MRKLVPVAAATTILFGAATASAEKLDGPGTDLIIGFERMFGISYFNADTNDYDSIAFGLLWQRVPDNPYAIPRVAFDAAIWRSLTVGGSLGFYVIGGDPELNGFFLYPRAGWIFDIARDFAIWPRGGFHVYFENGAGDYTEFGLGVDGMFVWMPLRNVGFMAGPSLDIGLVGDGPGGVNLNQFSTGIDFGALIHW